MCRRPMFRPPPTTAKPPSRLPRLAPIRQLSMSVFSCYWFPIVALAGGLFKIGSGTLAVVRLLSCAEEQQAYDNKVCTASFPMPFHASSMPSFAVCLSKPLVSPWEVGDMLAHPSVVRQFPVRNRSLTCICPKTDTRRPTSEKRRSRRFKSGSDRSVVSPKGNAFFMRFWSDADE